MTSLITLHLDGPFEALGPDGAPLQSLSKRGQALLAYLACQRGMSAPRGILMELLWSDRSRDQASASLRQELSRLRKSLPAGTVEADRTTVWLTQECVAVTRGDGAFLDGFNLASTGFEDWQRETRTQRAGTRGRCRRSPAVRSAAQAFQWRGSRERTAAKRRQ